ncbi:hypothetical protein JYT89_02640 [Flavobacteriaceae bacterium AH-315-B10]|nr:hypothetical protein [Flavobacteriaceae bacterium AH-315-B10]
MNKKTINFLLTLFIAYILALFLPWWSVMVAALITSFLIPLKKASVFFIPFLAIALLWIIQSWLLSSANDFILAKKIATLFPLGGNYILLIIVTGIIGGLAAGISGIFGKQCKLVLK